MGDIFQATVDEMGMPGLNVRKDGKKMTRDGSD